MIQTYLSGQHSSRGHLKLLLRVDYFSFPFLFQSSIPCNLLKCGS
ncbi:hypothetical protein RJ641_005978 [Dillenia turbinata]|uniref:Uncharacterized protein n=1 Tax=Dillenia turbinata TaxID=194707 RepID=A0AAN8VH87_9MAGN